MGEGDFIKKPDRRFKLLILIQGLWAITLLVLALWWGTLLKQQSDEIASLQTQIGVPESQIQNRLYKTEHMITGESGTFVFLILVTNGILLLFFARDTKRSRSLEVFFASITHELRTPLTSIRLQAEALQDIQSNSQYTPYITRLLEDVGRLEGQVQEALELARIEGGGKLNLQSVPIKNFLQNRILPQYDLGEKRLSLKINTDEAFIQADLSALNIIFRNVFDNALKYSNQAPTELSIKGEKQEHFYFLEITHLNSNFSGERNHLGTLFYRGANSQGAGIGLYLILTLMQKMKGMADFVPKEGYFSTHLSFKIEKNEAIDA